MGVIEEAEKYLSLIPDDIREDPNWLIELLEGLLNEVKETNKELEQYKAVVDGLYDSFEENVKLRARNNKLELIADAAGNMVDMYDVSTGVEIAKSRILLEKALSNLREKE